MSDDDVHHGFKKLTEANWQTDDISRIFARDAGQWVAGFLEPKLKDHVPADLAALFEVARGAMVYGWFFYPLLTLGTDQCYRIAEAGLRRRCDGLGIATVEVTKNGRERPRSFLELQKALASRGRINAEDEAFWEAARKLRN